MVGMSRTLIIVHRRHSRVGRLGTKLTARGYQVEVRCPMEGDALPDDPGRYQGVAVLGGPMSANDDGLPGIRAELEWIPKVVESGTPFFGICLGAQMLARSLGGTVATHPEGRAEIGYYPISAEAEAADLFDDDLCVYHWHRDGFSIPEGAVRLARGQDFPNQAFRFQNAYGVQFHPEVTHEMMQAWITASGHRLAMPGAQCPDTQQAGYERHHESLGDWLDRFLDRWLGVRELSPV
jgi:GMP synthase (glutamine-hydrolysing)